MYLIFIFIEQCTVRIFLFDIFKRKIFSFARDHYRIFRFFGNNVAHSNIVNIAFLVSTSVTSVDFYSCFTVSIICFKYVVNINDAYEGLKNQLVKSGVELNTQAETNLPPRLRMATVYAVSQSVNGRVANTCNLSEDWVGYSTRYGDSVGDFSPLSKLTVQEVKAVGRALGLPSKVPIDGLCGKTDEDNLGFTYEVLDRYIREGICEDEEIKAKIDRMHRINQFKLELMPIFPYEP